SSNDIGQDYLDRYLVIIIDDLDIAKRKKENNTYNWGTYKIMSTIYKYLMVPRVIILTAYDHERLVAECEEYYIDQRHRFGDRPAGNDEFGNDKIKSEALQYMEKIFPIFS